jgi:amidase
MGYGEHHGFGMGRYGPIATTVGDLALALDVMAGTTEHREPAVDVRRLEVAVSWCAPAPGLPIGRAWQEAVVEAGRVLRHLGHHVSHTDPPYEQAAVAAAAARYLQGPVRDVEGLGLDVDLLQPRTRGHFAAGERMAKGMPVEPEQAARWQRRMAPFLEEHDVLVLPMCARTPPRAVAWHERSWQANIAANSIAYPFTGLWNLADVPAAAVPLGVHHGRPTAVQVVARQGREDLVLAVARQLEQTAGWTRHAPGWHVPVGASS